MFSPTKSVQIGQSDGAKPLWFRSRAPTLLTEFQSWSGSALRSIERLHFKPLVCHIIFVTMLIYLAQNYLSEFNKMGIEAQKAGLEIGMHVKASSTLNSITFGCVFFIIILFNKKKSRIRETLNLSTDADHRTYFFLFFYFLFFF